MAYARLRAAANHALSLDSTQSVAWGTLTLATISLDYDSVAALRLSRRAVSSDPRQSLAHDALSMATVLAGRVEDGVPEALLGFEADTLSATAAMFYLAHLHLARHVDAIQAVLPRMRLALAPDDIRAWEGWVHFMHGDAAGAAERFTWQWFGGWFGGRV